MLLRARLGIGGIRGHWGSPMGCWAIRGHQGCRECQMYIGGWQGV